MEIKKIVRDVRTKIIGPPSYWNDICPICETKAISGCRCCSTNGISNDRICANKHTWHWNNGRVVIGSHH